MSRAKQRVSYSITFFPYCMHLDTVLMTPVVIVFDRDKGDPMAITNSPGLTECDFPRGITGNFFTYVEKSTCIINSTVYH